MHKKTGFAVSLLLSLIFLFSCTSRQYSPTYSSESIQTINNAHHVWFQMFLEGIFEPQAGKLFDDMNDTEKETAVSEFHSWLAHNQMLYNSLSPKGIVALREITFDTQIGRNKLPIYQRMKVLNGEYNNTGLGNMSIAENFLRRNTF